ncbi:uncharacterized protein RAG0_14417 [Rhynchosporium agropyri]|uniref:Uncharacterized protein n=1 Tax=Rhynchosporium agropyri TaxID=914238 RepID=A0A1E1LGU4_9HELO|nr:uncharacterized protein RAG0_14417 [Rhynchosporium agropyri]
MCTKIVTRYGCGHKTTTKDKRCHRRPNCRSNVNLSSETSDRCSSCRNRGGRTVKSGHREVKPHRHREEREETDSDGGRTVKPGHRERKPVHRNREKKERRKEEMDSDEDQSDGGVRLDGKKPITKARKERERSQSDEESDDKEVKRRPREKRQSMRTREKKETRREKSDSDEEEEDIPRSNTRAWVERYHRTGKTNKRKDETESDTD